MRKYLWLLIIIPTLCYGASGDVASIGGKAVTAVSSVMGKAGTAILTMAGKPYSDGDSECTGKLVCQNNETATTGWDNSETWTSPDYGTYVYPAYTTTHLRGSQSLMLGVIDNAGAGDALSPTFAASGEVYFHFMIRVGTATPTDKYVVRLRDASHNNLWQLYWNDTSLYVSVGASLVNEPQTVALNTTYHVWGHYKKGTGSNCEGHLTVNTGTSRVDWDVTKTDANCTADATELYFLSDSTAGGQVIILDQILVDDADISTVAE